MQATTKPLFLDETRFKVFLLLLAPDLSSRIIIAWDQALQWGEKGQKTGSNRKNIGERSKPSGAVGEGERPPFPLTRLASQARLARWLFLSPTPIFSPFSPNAEPGPKLGLLVITLWVQSLNFQNCRNAKPDWRAFWVNDQEVVGKKVFLTIRKFYSE